MPKTNTSLIHSSSHHTYIHIYLNPHRLLFIHFMTHKKPWAKAHVLKMMGPHNPHFKDSLTYYSFFFVRWSKAPILVFFYLLTCPRYIFFISLNSLIYSSNGLLSHTLFLLSWFFDYFDPFLGLCAFCALHILLYSSLFSIFVP